MHIAIFDRMEECTDEEVQRLLPLVSTQRREQALRYKHIFGQFCCLKSWMMLAESLQNKGLGLEDWCYNEHGKPFWPNGPYFSISHCKHGIAVAIDEHPIGIDIEAIRHADDDLLARTMNEFEQSKIKNQKSKIESDREFTRLWTRKEAIVKAQGVGIQSFEQLQTVIDNRESNVETFEKEKYIYSIAYGKLCSISAKVQAADL